ncbi:interferon alpha/beta receptor 1b-like [Anguilla anguilla]|uniref:interferon alpha/beta receptor 1b-like n=1 Tax=Anguilla anguilla TaxID=7936 RepID=UPI0015ADD3EC|nr:interferon alpha/beta receptor 1b-like [Anguilla anguilla]
MNVGLGVAVIVMFLGHVYKASALLPSPQNVTLQTLNTRYVLVWTWDSALGCPANQTATFTAQYLPKFKLRTKKRDWKSACSETADAYCDFTSCDLYYMGVYMLRVRASCVGKNSKWVQLEFCPDKQAHLGPPSKVEAVPGIELLELRISDPLTSKSASMKEIYPEMYYLIVYWKDTQNAVKDYRGLNTSINIATLADLEPWTVYCFKVQSRFNFYNKISGFSETQCQRTTGRTPLWQIFLWFLASLVLCFLCVLLPSYGLFRFYWLIKATFFPSYQLPENIQEYLYDSSPDSDRPRLLTPESEVEVCCESLDVLPVVVLPEIHAPADPPGGLDPDPSRHSRQGSGDSGVYSNEEGSGQAGGSSTGAEPKKGTGPATERVKMVEIGVVESRTEGLDVAPCGRGPKCWPPTRVWAAEDVLEECV